QVTDRAGRPQADVPVLFVAPEAGPGGTFTDADPASPTWFRTRTGAGGIASAHFSANATPGVYLVGAAVEDSEARVTLALTNTAQPVAPALQPERARILVKQRLLLNYPEDEKLLLHGPVLLGTGTQIAAANPSAPETAATSYIA